MSNQYGLSRQDGRKGFVKAQQRKYMPKNQNQTLYESPNPTSTLSNSLRQSIPNPSVAATASSSAAASSGRFQIDASGDSVSSKAHHGNFVCYLPQDEAVATGLRAEDGGLDPVESQKVADLLNRELSRLLKLSPKEFWREVARDTSLHEFLDSFLKFRSRWYDFPHRGANGIVAGVIVGESEISRRVFMVLYRISSNSDPGARAADSLSPKDHAVLLQEKRLLDLPKLFDICAIYGHENEELTKVLVGNALRAQHTIHDNLTFVISHFLGIVLTMHQRFSSSLEALFTSGSNEDSGFSGLHADFLEVIDFINDAVESLDAFLSAYSPAAVFFSCPVEISYGNEDLLGTLARLHDSLLPSLHRGFRIIYKAREDETLSNIAISLKMLSTRIAKFGWKILEFCYLGDEVFRNDLPVPASSKMFPANVEDPVIRADILVQTLREINGTSLHIRENQNSKTFLQNIGKSFYVMEKIESLRKTGWILLDDEQFEYLCGILMYSPKAGSKEQPVVTTRVTSHKAQMDEDAAIIESKISQIKDLFPDYGIGFLAACLEAYNQNLEEVIQRILEGTLHADLQSLDTSLQTMPKRPSAVSINANNKGKGKLVDSITLAPTNSVSLSREQRVEGPSMSSSSSSSLGRYIRKSKNDLPDTNTLNNKNEKDSSRTAALISQYEYEDEYDDSFDDLGLSIAETGVEEPEFLGDKMCSNLEKSQESENNRSGQYAPSSKWGSRKQPQYYVKDGKNYSYKVAGSVAVANSSEASLVSQTQEALIYGLGRGGNFPLGAAKKLMEYYEEQDNQSDVSEGGGKANVGNFRGQGRRQGRKPRDSFVGQDNKQTDNSDWENRGNAGDQRGGRGWREVERPREVSEGQDDKQTDNVEGESRGNAGGYRGRGRRGGGRNNYRKDRAMNKHFSGLRGF